MVKKEIGFFVILCFLQGCKGKPEQTEFSARKQPVEVMRADTTAVVSVKSDTVNYKDSQGRKQGLWNEYLHGKLWKSETFKNGRRTGKCYEYLASGEVMETNYVNGVRHGYFLDYDPGKRVGNFVTYWENGTKLWSAFPWELEGLLVPVKGFITDLDTVEIKVPYNSGKLLYQGTVIGHSDLFREAIGIHKVYYESGELKAIIDYDRNSVSTFSKSGKILEKTTVDQKRMVKES